MSRRALIRVKRTVQAAATAMTMPPYTKPGHFYSPLTSRDDARRALEWQAADGAPGVAMAEDAQLALARSVQGILAWTPPGPRT